MHSISVVPLSFNTSSSLIDCFVDQIIAQNISCELVVVLESADCMFSHWKSSLGRLPAGFSFRLAVLPEGISSKGACLNHAISLSKGDFIMRCDMDDIILPTRMSDFLAVIHSSSLCDVYYSDMFSKDKKTILSYPSRYLSLYSIFRNPVPAPTVFFNRHAFAKYKVAYPYQNLCEDLSVILKFIDRKASFYKINTPSVLYSSQNLYRSSSNWLANAFVRMRRDRYDVVGLLSLLFGFFLFTLVFLYSFAKRLLKP